MVKNLPANAGATGDVGSIPGLGRFPGGGNGSPLQHSCLEILWTEEPGGLQSTRSQSRTWLSTHILHTARLISQPVGDLPDEGGWCPLYPTSQLIPRLELATVFTGAVSQRRSE